MRHEEEGMDTPPLSRAMKKKLEKLDLLFSILYFLFTASFLNDTSQEITNCLRKFFYSATNALSKMTPKKQNKKLNQKKKKIMLHI